MTQPVPAGRSRRPRLLDAFCCQGGASTGYRLAGFDVTGIDIAPQPRYPFNFVQGDAVAFIREYGHAFDVIHASPPCQLYSLTHRIQRRDHPDLIAPTRQALESTGRPWVIENVEDARGELRDPVTLCGAAFGLHTYRHRLFETGGCLTLTPPPHPEHKAAMVKMGRPLNPGDWYHAVGNFSNVPYVRADMGVHWMTRDGIRECIPPAYTQWVGEAFHTALQAGAVAA
ncbi:MULTISPECIES: DNA cytosine methyltransferase [unclassified Streptomyces]|uniref:DNA cytosine methyltransferase n=1 Tax=unclassified Streptomyces TaxID=2593676 RepID=UPI0003801AEF|nr:MULTISPECIES: DNA cytosine methyltransferase [unclassified Streptomyces]MYX36040.1 SAM-dependent methyltransferase [Streptomyces sp. SID8377]